MDLYKFAWLIWIVGTILIVLSWDGTVSSELGWAGFVIALIGVGLSFIPHIQVKRKQPPHSPQHGDNTKSSAPGPDAAAGRPRDERFFER